MIPAVPLLVRVVFVRAILLWALVRLVFAVLPLAAGAAFGSMPVPPVGVIILAGALGLLDVRVRRERVLWGNLGVMTGTLAAAYAGAAASGELLLAMVLG